MKKALFIIFVLLCITLFSSCGGDKKDLPSDRFVQFGNKIIEIVDMYADYDITAEQAYNKLEDLRTRESELTDAEPGTDDYFNGSKMQNFIWNISLDLNSLKVEPSSERLKKLIENRNALAEVIGADKR